jgi:hypothetical protein
VSAPGPVLQPSAMSEREALLTFLASQRHHVAGILDGLDDAALRQAVLPSGWSCLGLVRHLTLDVERFWFRAVIGGEDVELATGAEAWHVPSDTPARDILDLYRQETQAADRAIATAGLDEGPRWWPEDLFPGLPRRDLRRVILHVTTETACHAGHLDAVRELLEGRQWLVLT